ncbi:hypothetical protein BC833DRAFT_295892 [Globomyces pollinis-pini]|nr:hypothetical protein BC833DRAFT_295892 [Globomyces pollinis-pini]
MGLSEVGKAINDLDILDSVEKTRRRKILIEVGFSLKKVDSSSRTTEKVVDQSSRGIVLINR